MQNRGMSLIVPWTLWTTRSWVLSFDFSVFWPVWVVLIFFFFFFFFFHHYFFSLGCLSFVNSSSLVLRFWDLMLCFQVLSGLLFGCFVASFLQRGVVVIGENEIGVEWRHHLYWKVPKEVKGDNETWWKDVTVTKCNCFVQMEDIPFW